MPPITAKRVSALRSVNSTTEMIMTKNFLKTILTLACAATLLSGCATNPGAQMAATSAVATSTSLGTQRLNQYSRMTLDPVDITVVGGEHWKGVSATQRTEAVKLTSESFARVLAKLPGKADNDNALRLHLTVEDVKLASTVRSAISHVLPIGLIANAGKSAAGGSAHAMGSVTIVGELRDAHTNALVASFSAEETPDPMSFGASFSQDGAMQAAIERTADDFAKALANARKGDTDGVAAATGGRLKFQVAAS